MSTNTDVPFNWNNQNDNALFGSLFPNGLNAPNFEDVFSSTNPYASKKRNALSYSPLSKNGNSVRDNFFGGSKPHTYGNFQIIVDSGCNFDPKEKIKAIEECFFIDTNNSGVYGDIVSGVEDEYIFTVKLFISEIKDDLEAIYNDPTVVPSDYEILLFLENNKGDWSSSTMYAKKGKNVTESQFKGLLQSGSNNDEKGYAHYLESRHNISSSELMEFLDNGVIRNKFLEIISCLFEFTSLFVSNPVVLNSIAFGIETAIEAIKKECLIEEQDWNPTSTDFKPFLFQGVSNLLDSIDDEKINQYLKNGLVSLKTHIDQKDAIIEKAILGISKAPLISIIPFIPTIKIPDTFSELLLQKYHYLRTKVYSMLADADNLDFSNMAKEAVYCINAFLCGVWNGFVEAVCGIISLIKYLFEGAGFLADLLENFKIKGPEILEKIDDITSAFHKLDFGKIFTNLVASAKSFIHSEHTVSLVEISYFSGMFIGFVVELAIEIVGGILLTGGVLTVEAVLAKIGQTFKAIASLIYGAMKLPVSLAGKTISGFMQALHWLYEFLAKGTDEIVRIIDEVFSIFKEYGRDIQKLHIVPNNDAQIKLFKSLLKLFYNEFRVLLIEFENSAYVLQYWKKLKTMKDLAKQDIEMMLNWRNTFVGKKEAANVAIMKQRIKINDEILELEYKAFAGRERKFNNVDGFCKKPDRPYIAKQLGMTDEELMLHYETLEKQGIMRRFYDSEHKIFAQNDQDLHALFARHGKENIQIIEQNVKTLFEPCVSCKKQFIIRKKLYNIENLTIEATRKNNYEFVKTNEQFLSTLNK